MGASDLNANGGKESMRFRISPEKGSGIAKKIEDCFIKDANIEPNRTERIIKLYIAAIIRILRCRPQGRTRLELQEMLFDKLVDIQPAVLGSDEHLKIFDSALARAIPHLE